MMPDRDHPIWPILRQVLIIGTVAFMLWFNYNSVDSRDLVTILAAVAAGGVGESFGKIGTRRPPEG